MSRRLGVAVVVLLALAAPAFARPDLLVIDQPVDAGKLTEQGLVPYNTLFLNRCASGCVITKATSSNSITDSWPIPGTTASKTLTKFPYSDDVWNQVVSCVKDTFEPYNVNVVETDPGSANHFEIMIAGPGSDLGYAPNIGGIAPGAGSSCTSYINNALVFDFARIWGTSTACNARCVEDICATAAQEIGHTWQRLDHVIVKEDPMTYFTSATRKYFQTTAAQCGSDCDANHLSPTSLQCYGTDFQSHDCICGGKTQNSHNVITGLFGAGPTLPPIVKITEPRDGQHVMAGFAVRSEATDNSGTVTKVEFRVDGQLVTTLTVAPYIFTAPAGLADGSHTLEVTAYDPHGYAGKATSAAVIAPPCVEASDCGLATDTCVSGHCVLGPGAEGGLGQPCAGNTDCASGQCGADGTNMYCVETCLGGDCPDDFGCILDDGAQTGVCWPGYDEGGGCGCQSNRGGPLGMMVLIGWLVFTCRRRRAHS